MRLQAIVFVLCTFTWWWGYLIGRLAKKRKYRKDFFNIERHLSQVDVDDESSMKHLNEAYKIAKEAIHA